jgi:hypothetical protein
MVGRLDGASRDGTLPWQLPGDWGYNVKKYQYLYPQRKATVMGTRQTWGAILVMLVGLLFVGADFGHADRGRYGDKGHGYKSHGHRSHGHRNHGHREHRHSGHGVRHGFKGSQVGIGIGLGTFWGSDWGWGPAWPGSAYPPVVMAPPPVMVQPSPLPPQYWYYCDTSQAYYPYVPQCPGGWRAVTPTLP